MMKKILIYLIFVLTSISQQAVAEYPRHHLRGNDGKDIIYYLIQRDNTPSEDLLVLIQGSDCQSVINNQSMIENFGSVFPENDILLVEKSGLDSSIGKKGTEVEHSACPQAYMQNDSPSKRVKDYLTVLNQLKNKYHHIVLLGGSEGAIVTNMIASKADFITAAISINGGGRFFIDDVIHSIKRGSPAEMSDKDVNSFKVFAEEAKRKRLPAGMTVSGHGANWWYDSLSIDNQKMIQSSKIPLLVIQCMSDNNVDAAGARKMIAAIDNPMVSFKTYEGLDHFFKDSDGNYHAATIIKDIKNWYQSQIKITAANSH
ncbi:acyl-CoA thioester hydrolase/BAAT C-terminal domain-containing protein [Xenorhabdus doucetiae]|uniref:acyl-CoA thioester hydrolase/BAAT C-terminal domain-containing protein n=1 Tax=Xenorhabdus doucetiae TaxID=351671 RepID=UPI002B403FB2|nr:acyl-CoA thioester hydrolase/BAAT C-terminal domain-containing protein [Xenorhabdus sp. 18]